MRPATSITPTTTIIALLPACLGMAVAAAPGFVSLPGWALTAPGGVFLSPYERSRVMLGSRGRNFHSCSTLIMAVEKEVDQQNERGQFVESSHLSSCPQSPPRAEVEATYRPLASPSSTSPSSRIFDEPARFMATAAAAAAAAAVVKEDDGKNLPFVRTVKSQVGQQQQQQQQQQEQKELSPTRPQNHQARGSRRKRPLLDAKQLSPQEVKQRWPDTNFEVPTNMSAAVTLFLEQSTPQVIILGILSVVTARLSCDDALGLTDAAAVPLVAAGWSIQEWAIHKYLLHGMKGWMGHEASERHHEIPFYHVCIDPPELIGGWMIAAACIFRLLLPLPLTLTVVAVYMFMGLASEWIHYISHTRVVPRSRIWKLLKKHHTLHHLSDESCWMSLTAPPIDTLFGTVPTDQSTGHQSKKRIKLDGHRDRR